MMGNTMAAPRRVRKPLLFRLTVAFAGGLVAMGLGFALSERVLYEDGVNLTGTFAQYLIPTAVEAPEIEPIVVESGEGLGPFSARGIGEPPVGAVAPAVAAALAEALGRRLTVLPFTPERVAEA